jgi:protein-ribulosamine 3-kinase
VKVDALGGAIAECIAKATGEGFAPLAQEGVSGGCIHRALRIEGRTTAGTRAYFAKANDAASAAMFACEAEGLEALRAAGSVRVPRVIARGDDGERSWLVLEWLDLAPLAGAAAARLGEALAAQHRIAQQRFGWGRDNFIGASPQPNGWSDDWLGFWRSCRLMAQLRLAAGRRLPSRMIDRGERLAADCEAFFQDHRPGPSLLHGDLWSGNAAMTPEGEPVLFDPAAYMGDREADVAMTELFGGFPADFGAAYRATWPMEDGYRARRDFYNLYHLLNHANLFGGGYVRQAEQSIERLLAEIG